MSDSEVTKILQPNTSPSYLKTEFEYRLLNPSLHTYEMPGIWQLTAGNLVSMGDVEPSVAMKAAKDKAYDFFAYTRVIRIVHNSGQLVGTFSMTVDNDNGMPVTRHFADELAELRRNYRLVNGWRFSMLSLFNGGVLRQRTMSLFKQLCWMSDADAFVIYYNERLQRYYDRLFKGRVVTEKTISFDGENQLPVRVMLCEAAHNQPDPKYMHEGALYENGLDFE